MAFARQDSEKAQNGVMAIARWLEKKNLSWTLDTITKHFTTWLKSPEDYS